MTVSKSLFRLLARANKAVLPKQWHKDLARLNKVEKLLVAWRIWVTKNAL
ncbi:MAG TPA: SsrA-binding protein [Flavobacteriales bacterium]|nr:SsrA-binding protein [Flavobacteriales bacterium]